MSFAPEPPFRHDQPARLGVLLVNLGTPDAPTAGAVRRYLSEFLSDQRVVELPRALWLPLLHGLILWTRPARSARNYAKIWTRDGSPLLVHSQRQRTLLLGYLGQRMKAAGLPAGHCPVELGMRYGEPSIGAGLDRLRSAGAQRILVLPLYPQYAMSTTAATLDAVAGYFADVRRTPALRFVDSFHDDPGYIKALAQSINDDWVRNGRPDHLVLSFHGVPQRSLEQGDPYHCQCHKTARLLAAELGLETRKWTLSFQSRFGWAEWLQPYTTDVLTSLAESKVGRVDVACPGFVADCLETLEEIGIAGREHFLKAGGRELRVIPCVNEHPLWIAALADLAWRNLQGWLEAPPDAPQREMTLLRAKGAGAAR
jgi:protoporphyrin/coproporphyrin ferrochelatase